MNHLDFKLYGNYPTATNGINTYWENCYDYLDGPKSVGDEFLTYYLSFGRLALSHLNPPMDEENIAQQNSEEMCRLQTNQLRTVNLSFNILKLLANNFIL